MARQLYLEDNEIQTVINALYSKRYGLLKEIKGEDSSYNKSSVIKETVDNALQHTAKLISYLESVKDGKLEQELKDAQSRL